MSKLVSLLIAGSGATVASVGGVYILEQGVGNSSSEQQPGQDEEHKQSGSTISNELPAKTGEEFKEDDKRGECVTKHFQNVSFKSNTTTISDSNKVESSYFDSSTGGSKSCLVLNWEKEGPITTGDNKGSGTLRWVGSFVDGNKGFVMFTLIKPSSTDSTFEMEGGIYVLEKSSGSGAVKGSKNLDDSSKTINSENFTSMFPTVGSALGLNDEKLKTNGGFIGDAGTELGKLCKSGEADCPSTSDSSKKFKGSWTWEKTGEGNEKWSKWSENMDQWLFKLYPNKDGLDLNGALGTSAFSSNGSNPNLTKPTANSKPAA